jgi:hypothetical protein
MALVVAAFTRAGKVSVMVQVVIKVGCLEVGRLRLHNFVFGLLHVFIVFFQELVNHLRRAQVVSGIVHQVDLDELVAWLGSRLLDFTFGFECACKC